MNRGPVRKVRRRKELVQGYRHQKVGKIITKTVIVEKVKRKRCIGRICMKNEKEEEKKKM